MTAPVVAHNAKRWQGVPSSDKCTPKPSTQRVMVPYQELVQLMPRSHFCHGELLITGIEGCPALPMCKCTCVYGCESLGSDSLGRTCQTDKPNRIGALAFQSVTSSHIIKL